MEKYRRDSLILVTIPNYGVHVLFSKGFFQSVHSCVIFCTSFVRATKLAFFLFTLKCLFREDLELCQEIKVLNLRRREGILNNCVAVPLIISGYKPGNAAEKSHPLY